MLFRTLILKASGLRFMKWVVKETRLFRGLVRRFIAGEDLDDALRVAEDLAGRGLLVTLDLLGENVHSLDEACRSKEAYERIVERIAVSPRCDRINVSIKLTALGLDQGEDVAERNLCELLTAAAAHDIFVCVDMEGSDYTERTIAMVQRVHPQFSNIGTVLQSYLKRTPDDVETLIALGARVRIVKGAYLEPETIAFQDKETVDAKYVEAAKRLMKGGQYPAIATHDERIIQELLAFAEAEGIGPERYEWQMLYGIRRDRQDSLLAEGFNVRVYVPFGADWYPYFSRRLAERPANLFFLARATLGK